MSYSLTATNTGKVPLTGAVVSVDVTHVLDHATLGALPSGVSLNGTTLTWAVPTTPVGAVATTAIPVTVQAAAHGATLSATAEIDTLGGTCAACAITHTVAPAVSPPPPPAPGTIGAECQVAIHGKARVGRTLRAAVEGCPAGAGYALRWYAGGQPIKGALRATYQVRRSKLGQRISVRVTVSAAGYVAAERISPATRKVR